MNCAPRCIYLRLSMHKIKKNFSSADEKSGTEVACVTREERILDKYECEQIGWRVAQSIKELYKESAKGHFLKNHVPSSWTILFRVKVSTNLLPLENIHYALASDWPANKHNEERADKTTQFIFISLPYRISIQKFFWLVIGSGVRKPE